MTVPDGHGPVTVSTANAPTPHLSVPGVVGTALPSLGVAAEPFNGFITHAEWLSLHDEFAAAGVEVGPVTHPFYMPAGELRVEDPDAYGLLVGQLGDAA